MKFYIEQSDRGFRHLFRGGTRFLCEASRIGDYDDSLDCPGSSFLWMGDSLFDREDVATLRDTFARLVDDKDLGVLRDILTHWLEKKRLPEPGHEILGKE